MLDLRAQALAEMAQIRAEHAAELRRADQQALNLALENTREHFERLNENAARTIEERAHFVAQEVFEPFRIQVLDVLATSRGRSSGIGVSANALVIAAGLMVSVLGLILAAYVATH